MIQRSRLINIRKTPSALVILHPVRMKITTNTTIPTSMYKLPCAAEVIDIGLRMPAKPSTPNRFHRSLPIRLPAEMP